MADTATLPEPERGLVKDPLERAPGLAATVDVAKRLALLLRHQRQEDLDPVLTEAEATPLARFAVELRKDLPAVQAALCLRWTTSPVEGQISRLKMIKRTMYGRAGFELLRARVLHPA